MKSVEMSRTRLFGIFVLMYGLFMFLGSAIEFALYGPSLSIVCLSLGGVVMTVGGAFVIVRADKKAMEAIGIFAISYAIFKMLRAVGDGGDAWIVPFVLAIPFLVMGYKYLKGTVHNVVFTIAWCIVYALVDVAYIITDPNTLNVIDIFILGVLVSILASKDVLAYTTLKRNYNATRIEVHGRVRADVNLLKATLDDMGDWMKHGSAVGKSKLRDSLEEHRTQVAKVIEVAHGPKTNRALRLHRMEEPVKDNK